MPVYSLPPSPIMRLDVSALVSIDPFIFSSIYLAEANSIPHSQVLRSWRASITRDNIFTLEPYIRYRKDSFNRFQEYLQMPNFEMYSHACSTMNPKYILPSIQAYCIMEASQVAILTVSLQYLEALLSTTLNKVVYVDTGNIPRHEIRYALGEAIINNTKYSRWAHPFNMPNYLDSYIRVNKAVPSLFSDIGLDPTPYKIKLRNKDTYHLPKPLAMLLWTQFAHYCSVNDTTSAFWPYNIIHGFNHFFDEDIIDIANYAYNTFIQKGISILTYDEY